MYGHVHKMQESIVEGLKKSGVNVKVFRVAETLPEAALKAMGADKIKFDTEVIKMHGDNADDITQADGFMFGFPTRFGMMPSQMKAFFDATGGLWFQKKLIGKPAAFFYSTNTLGGGQETTALTAVTQLTHHGMIFVPLGYQAIECNNVDEVHGGGPWGSGCIAKVGKDPSKLELSMACQQGELFGKFIQRLH